MSKSVASLITLQNYSTTQIYSIFEKANNFAEKIGYAEPSSIHTASLLFFEASTRTRCSFELAAANLGMRTSLLSGRDGTSLEKGETVEDTILNIAAMQPDVLVVRCGDSVELEKIAEQVSVPVVNAGWGKQGHPTQALLDCYTLYREFGDLKHKKVLIVGDVKHSRVATSNMELMSKMGIHVAICTPPEFLPESKNIQNFKSLKEGLAWADAVMALRCQFERHESQTFNKQTYIEKFQLNPDSLRDFKGVIMHPGPINHGVEMQIDTFRDSRSRIFAQVKNGVLVRMAVFSTLIGMGT